MTAGASLAVVASIALLGIASPSGYVWFAFLGALAGTVLVYAIGSAGRGGATPVTLALAGAALSALLYGLVRAVLVSDQQTLDSFRFWVVGSLAGRGARRRLAGGPVHRRWACCSRWPTPPRSTCSASARTSPAGSASASGSPALVGLTAITLLCGAATAACGPIAFVGLVVPHAVRAVTGPDHRWLIPCSGLAGAVLLLTADVVGRVVARPGELQVGIVLALIGAPFFIALVRRRRTATL